MADQVTLAAPDLPPSPLAARTGAIDPANPLHGYERLGKELKDYIVAALPPTWSFADKRVLDFGCGAGRVLRAFAPEAETAEFYGCDIDEPSIDWLQRHLSPPFHVLRSSESPPLSLPDESFDLIWGISVFTHITDEWSGWLLDLHRLLNETGYLLLTFLGSGMSQLVAGEPWVEDRVGMNVLRYDQSWDLGGPMVMLSPWWIREHWGRAFEIVDLREAGVVTASPSDGQGMVVMRKRRGAFTRADLERVDFTAEPRELSYLQHNVGQLHRESLEFRQRAESLEHAYRALEASRAVRVAKGARRLQRALRKRTSRQSA